MFFSMNVLRLSVLILPKQPESCPAPPKKTSLGSSSVHLSLPLARGAQTSDAAWLKVALYENAPEDGEVEH